MEIFNLEASNVFSTGLSFSKFEGIFFKLFSETNRNRNCVQFCKNFPLMLSMLFSLMKNAFNGHALPSKSSFAILLILLLSKTSFVSLNKDYIFSKR